jgi:hypothetical protein
VEGRELLRGIRPLPAQLHLIVNRAYEDKIPEAEIQGSAADFPNFRTCAFGGRTYS